jgi:hypothetical protein
MHTSVMHILAQILLVMAWYIDIFRERLAIQYSVRTKQVMHRRCSPLFGLCYALFVINSDFHWFCIRDHLAGFYMWHSDPIIQCCPLENHWPFRLNLLARTHTSSSTLSIFVPTRILFNSLTTSQFGLTSLLGKVNLNQSIR